MGMKGLIIGFGAGYVLGAKAGRERYEQIHELWGKLSGNPTVQKAAGSAKQFAGEASRKGVQAVQGGVTKASGAVKSRLGEDSETTSRQATGT
jgi:uncharacterized protein YjbJ (UPF0337 family)